jgi:flavin-binding protein dodecin
MAQEKKTNAGSSSCFQIITVIGISPESWEKAAASAVEQASKMYQVAATEGIELTMHLENGKVGAYIAKVKLAANLTANPK